MSSWQRRARLLIGVFVLAFGTVVFFAIGGRRDPATSPRASRLDPNAVVETSGARVIQAKGEKQDFKVEFARSVTYASGAMKLETVKVYIFQRAGRNFVITSREAQIGEKQSKVDMMGDVVLHASDGLVAKGDRATYDEGEGMVRVPGRVEFSRGTMTGSGIGATYDRHRDVLWLLDQAHIRIAPDRPGGEPAEVTAGTAGFARRDRYIRLERGAKVVRSGRTMEADAATAYLTEDEKRIQMVEMRGNARVSGGPGGGGALQTMHARDINLIYADDGQALRHATLAGGASIQVAGANGQRGRRIAADLIDMEFGPNGATVMALTGRDGVELEFPAEGDAPARRVRASALDATGGPNSGLTSAKLRDNVEYRETRPAIGKTPAVDRLARGRGMGLEFQPGFGAIEEARFVGDATVKDGALVAEAAHIRYVLPKGIVELTTPADLGGPLPRVTDEQGTIRANTIEVTLETRAMVADGDVRSEYRQTPGAAPRGGAAGASAAAKMPGMLNESQAVNVTGKRLAYEGSGHAVYTGDAKLWQGETAIQGDSIDLDEGTGNLVVKGGVKSTLLLEQENQTTKEKEKVSSIATAADLVYDDKLRRATYTQQAHVSGPQGDLTADRIELFFDKDGDALERAEAFRGVTLRLDVRSATGEQMTYFAADERYVMSGTPVKVVDLCRETIGRTLTFFKSTDTIRVDSNQEIRTQSKAGGKCPEPKPQ